MKQLNKFNEAVVNAIYRSEDWLISKFNIRSIEVKHEDGSIYLIKHVCIKRVKVGKYPCIMVYCEHSSPILFVEYDLESVKVTPWKGRSKKLKLSKYKFKK